MLLLEEVEELVFVSAELVGGLPIQVTVRSGEDQDNLLLDRNGHILVLLEDLDEPLAALDAPVSGGVDGARNGTLTVMVGGEALRSCSVPVSAVAGRDVTTLEGLGTPEKPHPLQKAFLDEQAAQCGYCTNGMIMQAKDLVTRNPNATLEQVKQGLANNLCKCGTHTRILKAVMRVVEGGVA